MSMENYEIEKNMKIKGKMIRPDFVIDFGDRGKVSIELKYIPGTNRNDSPKVSELEVFDLLNAFMMKYSEKSPCKFSFLEKDSQVFVKYDECIDIIGFTGYEAIICKRCFSNPSSPVNGKVLFDDFKNLKENNFTDIFNDEYERQVRSATERVNKKLKVSFDIKDDILTYSAIPQVTVNSKFLK